MCLNARESVGTRARGRKFVNLILIERNQDNLVTIVEDGEGDKDDRHLTAVRRIVYRPSPMWFEK